VFRTCGTLPSTYLLIGEVSMGTENIRRDIRSIYHPFNFSAFQGEN